MAAYYAAFTTYARPDSLTRLPDSPAPMLMAGTRAVHSGGRRHSAVHKLLLPVRAIEIASMDTAKFMHRVFVAHAPSSDQQSAFAEETHRAIPDSTRDPCRHHMCYRLASG